jgi:hypothetical protein
VVPNADPFALLHRLDDVGRHHHAANLFDFRARDRLAVRDESQRFKQRSRIAAGLFGPHPRDPGVYILAYLIAKAGRYFLQLDASPLTVTGQRFERTGNEFGADVVGFVEKVA